MSRLRIALVNASTDGNTPRNFRRELDADLVEFDAQAGEFPAVEEVDAAVVTGSSASVYWEEPWIEQLRASLRDADDRGLPLLGVCFGHQAIAAALGGEVADMGEYEIGYRTVEHSGGRPFAGIDPEFTVFTTHSDEVVELPPGAEVLAENDYSIQGFRRGTAWGVQFHPEYDRRTAREVTEGKGFEPEREQRILDGITRENYQRSCEAKQLFDNFTEYVRDRAEAADAAADD